MRSIIGQIDVYVRLGTGVRAYVGKDYAIDSVRVHVAQQQQEAVTETETDTETDATRAGPKGINLANLRGLNSSSQTTPTTKIILLGTFN